MLRLVYLLAMIWGVVWAAFLQFVPLGRFLAQKRTWMTVVIGVGVDLLLLLLVMPWRYWRVVAMVITLSSVGIIFRSGLNEWEEWRELVDVYTDEAGE